MARSRFDGGLTELTDSRNQAVARVLNRGIIETPAEYRALSSRADRLAEDLGDDAELQQINRLLAKYDSAKNNQNL